MDPTARFTELVGRTDADIPLDEAALLIGAHAAPGLDVELESARLDELAAGCAGATVDAVVEHLFGSLGFHGNHEDYYDPRNSYLHEVVARRTGIPISLAVLTTEVARRRGVALEPVAMPGHFLLRERDGARRFVDTFDGGALVDAPGCEAIFRRLHPDADFDVAFLEPVTTSLVLIRMLGNLAGIFRQQRDRANLLWVLELRAALPAMGGREQRELAAVLAARGRFDAAATTLESLGRPEDARAARRLRARLN